jgi:SAM-dependent methyltransferase
VRRAFDVGGAYGHLLQYLGRHGIEGAGCDLSPDVARWGREHLGVALHAGSVSAVEEPAASFDAVLCMDTLYYAHDPGADLRAMRRLLKPGGVLVLRLRNGRGARVREAGSHGMVRVPMPLEHLWLFTPASIAAVLRHEGFEVLDYRAASYSDTRWAGVTGLWTAFAEWLRRLGGGRIPPLTHSFYVIARPAA